MNAAQLLNAYREYAAAAADHGQSFDLASPDFFDHAASALEQSAEALAGELIHEHGSLERALAVALTHALDGSGVSERNRAAYQRLVWAAE